MSVCTDKYLIFDFDFGAISAVSRNYQQLNETKRKMNLNEFVVPFIVPAFVETVIGGYLILLKLLNFKRYMCIYDLKFYILIYFDNLYIV